MIYSLVGTNQTVREKAQAEMVKFGTPSAHIYSEHLSTIESLLDATSLFGDAIVAHLIQVLEKAEGRDVVYDLLPKMEESKTIFIIDEPFADANRVKKLEKYSKKLYDAREEKEREASPFSLTNAFARRDKKNAWIEWMELRDKLEPEVIQGALWWKFQMIWSDTKSGRPSKFTLDECERLGKKIMESSVLAHRGLIDFKSELEAILLSI